MSTVLKHDDMPCCSALAQTSRVWFHCSVALLAMQMCVSADATMKCMFVYCGETFVLYRLSVVLNMMC
jgi:hypothetical protein